MVFEICGNWFSYIYSASLTLKYWDQGYLYDQPYPYCFHCDIVWVFFCFGSFQLLAAWLFFLCFHLAYCNFGCLIPMIFVIKVYIWCTISRLVITIRIHMRANLIQVVIVIRLLQLVVCISSWISKYVARLI